MPHYLCRLADKQLPASDAPPHHPQTGIHPARAASAAADSSGAMPPACLNHGQLGSGNRLRAAGSSTGGSLVPLPAPQTGVQKQSVHAYRATSAGCNISGSSAFQAHDTRADEGPFRWHNLGRWLSVASFGGAPLSSACAASCTPFQSNFRRGSPPLAALTRIYRFDSARGVPAICFRAIKEFSNTSRNVY